jgi:hypothetical protein
LYFLPQSQKRLLDSLNPLFLVLLVFGVIIIRTTWEPLFPRAFHHWDVLLPFIVYFGHRRSIPEGIILSLFASHLFSLNSSAPIGVFTCVYLTLFTVARLLSYVVYAHRWFSVFLLMLSLAVLSRIILTLTASLFGHGWPLFSFANFTWWAILLNAVSGSICFWVLEWVDRLTFKAPRLNIELSEGGL